MNHDTIAFKKDENILQLSGSLHQLMDNDAYFADDIPHFVTAEVPIPLLNKWRLLLWSLQDHLVLPYELDESDSAELTVLSLQSPTLFYWNEAEDGSDNICVIPLTCAETSKVIECGVVRNPLSHFDTQLHLKSDGELVIFGAPNTLVSWSFPLGFIEDLVNVAESPASDKEATFHV